MNNNQWSAQFHAHNGLHKKEECISEACNCMSPMLYVSVIFNLSIMHPTKVLRSSTLNTGIFNQYSHHGFGKTFNSVSCLRNFSTKVDDKTRKFGGKQRLDTLDRNIIPFFSSCWVTIYRHVTSYVNSFLSPSKRLKMILIPNYGEWQNNLTLIDFLLDNRISGSKVILI